jgi:hypothetical protein
MGGRAWFPVCAFVLLCAQPFTVALERASHVREEFRSIDKEHRLPGWLGERCVMVARVNPWESVRRAHFNEQTLSIYCNIICIYSKTNGNAL